MKMSLIAVLGTCLPVLAYSSEGCVVNLYFYDKGGREVQGTVSSILVAESRELASADQLRRLHGVTIVGSSITFSKPLHVGGETNVVVDFRDRPSFTGRLIFTSCGQRLSFNIDGFSDPDGNNTDELIGSLKGCSNYKGWWVRSIPMFGWDGTLYPESDVDPISGRFRLMGILLGARLVLFVGKGSEVVAVTHFDVKGASGNVVAPIEVKKACEK